MGFNTFMNVDNFPLLVMVNGLNNCRIDRNFLKTCVLKYKSSKDMNPGLSLILGIKLMMRAVMSAPDASIRSMGKASTAAEDGSEEDFDAETECWRASFSLF